MPDNKEFTKIQQSGDAKKSYTPPPPPPPKPSQSPSVNSSPKTQQPSKKTAGGG